MNHSAPAVTESALKGVISIALLLAVTTMSPQEKSGWMLGVFTRPQKGNPVIQPDPMAVFTDPMSGKDVKWEELHTFNPAAVVRGDSIYLLYRAEDNTGQMRIGGHTSRLGLAVSKDGVHFNKASAPVLFPAIDSQTEREWPGGVEDPRIVEAEDGTYILTYTQYNRKNFDIGIAISKDLIHWQKTGPAFQNVSDGKYRNVQCRSAGAIPMSEGSDGTQSAEEMIGCKSAGIVATPKNGRLIAARINGKYWMYWGEGTVRLATSTDLLHWSPVEDDQGNPVAVLKNRPRHFDSGFPEMGPPPVLTSDGIVVIYNGKNDSSNGDPKLPVGTYASGQALFSANDPTKLLKQSDKPFFAPTTSFERTGQYAEGTTFAEGLVLFKNCWFLYYGASDSFVGVAIAPMRG